MDNKTINILNSYLKMIDNARNEKNPCIFDYSDVILSDIYASIKFVLNNAGKEN